MAEQSKWGAIKFLGKLYIDRHRGKALDEPLLQRAVSIIRDQAPSRNKLKITISATEKTIQPGTNTPIAACLVGADQNGDVAIKTAILNILSLGRIGHIMYYVTAGLETELHSRTVQPGWVPRRGTQLSLVSIGSRGSSVTLNSLSSAQSGHSKRTLMSGLSANTAEATSAGHHLQPSFMGPPTSVSQHALSVGGVGNTVGRGGTVWHKKADAKQASVPSRKQGRSPSAWHGKSAENAPALLRQPSLNLDDYLSIVNI
eukprot:gene18072-9571_t